MLILGTDIEFRFPEPGPEMFRLTCANHPTGKWLTKCPGLRSIHWIGWGEDGFDYHPEFGGRECPCTWDRMRVVLDDGQLAEFLDRRALDLSVAEIEALLRPMGTI